MRFVVVIRPVLQCGVVLFYFRSCIERASRLVSSVRGITTKPLPRPAGSATQSWRGTIVAAADGTDTSQAGREVSVRVAVRIQTTTASLVSFATRVELMLMLLMLHGAVPGDDLAEMSVARRRG